MQMIDTHVHIWLPGTPAPAVGHPYDGPATAADLIAEMDSAGVHGAILITPRALGTDNRCALAAVREYPGRCLGVVSVVDHRNPWAEAARLEREAAAGGLVGIRVHPCFDPDLDLGHPDLAPVWAACTVAMLPVLVHADPAQYGQVEALAAAHPGLDIAVDHLGRLPLAAGTDSPAFARLLKLAEHPRVHLKISSAPWLLRGGLPPAALEPFAAAALAAYGPDRLMWGSDWPVLLGVNGTYIATATQARELPLPAGARAAFLAHNARRFHRLAQ